MMAPAVLQDVGVQSGGNASGHDRSAGIVYAPEEVFSDPHFLPATGRPTWSTQNSAERSPIPGAPYRLTQTPWAIRSRAPFLGEHQAIIG